MDMSFEDVTESIVLAQNDYGANLVYVPLDEVAHHSRLPSRYWPADAERKPTYDFSINSLYKRL